MMKKKILLPFLMFSFLAASCSSEIIVPSANYPGIPDYPSPGGGGGDPDVPTEFNMTVNFFKSYSESANPDKTPKPFYSMRWYTLKEIGEVPLEAVLTDQDAPDPLYPHFIGYSEYPSAIDESLLWDFAEDYYSSNILNLYGIWVCEQEVSKMNKRLKYLAFIPVMLLASCNFKYEYFLPAGVEFYTSGSSWEGDEDIEDGGTYTIKVWVDKKIVSLTKSQIQSFESASKGKYKINAEVVQMSEGEAATKMLQDVDSGADIFVFAQDQLSRLKTAVAIGPLSTALANHLKEQNTEGSVQAATLGDKMYAFPMTSDNGYFLYYDKSILSAEDVKDMGTMLAKLKAKGKKLNFDRKNGFYAASYFLATGCYSHWTFDEQSGAFIKPINDNYNSDAGVKAALAYRALADNSVVAGNKSTWTSSAGAVITGVWEYNFISSSEAFGKNAGCAELPYFADPDDSSKKIHMSSFDGYKLMGVKPQKDKKKASVCRKIAEFLTNRENQLNRFMEVNWGPTNIEAASNPDVASHPALAALQKQHEFAKPQENCPGAWFTALGGLAGSITTNSTVADIKALLSNYEKGLPELLDD